MIWQSSEARLICFTFFLKFSRLLTTCVRKEKFLVSHHLNTINSKQQLITPLPLLLLSLSHQLIFTTIYWTLTLLKFSSINLNLLNNSLPKMIEMMNGTITQKELGRANRIHQSLEVLCPLYSRTRADWVKRRRGESLLVFSSKRKRESERGKTKEEGRRDRRTNVWAQPLCWSINQYKTVFHIVNKTAV